MINNHYEIFEISIQHSCYNNHHHLHLSPRLNQQPKHNSSLALHPHAQVLLHRSPPPQPPSTTKHPLHPPGHLTGPSRNPRHNRVVYYRSVPQQHQLLYLLELPEHLKHNCSQPPGADRHEYLPVRTPHRVKYSAPGVHCPT